METTEEFEKLTDGKIKLLKLADKKMNMSWRDRKSLTKLKEILELKTNETNVMEQRLSKGNNNVEEWETQLETRLMEIEDNNLGRLEQLIHKIQTLYKDEKR